MLRGEQTELQLLCFAFHYSAESPSVSESSFLGMNSLFDELGVLVSPEKDTPPCHQLLCYGVTINTLDMALTVPSFCVAELQSELRTWPYKPNFTKRQLPKLGGFFRHLNKVSSSSSPAFGKVVLCVGFCLGGTELDESFVNCLVVLFIFSKAVFPSCY